MSNNKKWHDTTPHLRAAGLGSAEDPSSARVCVEPDSQPGNRAETPAELKKFRSWHICALGKRKVNHAFANDPKTAEETVCGIKNNKSEKAADVLSPALKSDLTQLLELQKESIYKSSKSQLGRSYQHGTTLPDVFGKDHRFGVQTKKNESAKELICPPVVAEDPAEVAAAHARYVKSHRDYAPGEQQNRGYDWTRFGGKDSCFGESTKHNNDGKQVEQALAWKADADALRQTTVIASRVDEFRRRTQIQLGQVHDPIADTLNVPEDYVFGVKHAADVFGAGDLVSNRDRVEDVDSQVGASTALLKLEVPRGKTFGVPTIRTDVPAPTVKGISDHQNYGDEPTASGLVNPDIFSAAGVYEKDKLVGRDRAEMRDIFESIGITLTDEAFAEVWEKAQSWDPKGHVSVDSFHSAIMATF